MKKKFTIGLIALLSVSFIFFGCGGGDSSPQNYPFSTVADVTIAGESGTALAAAVDVVITIGNDSIGTAIAAGADLSGWITNLPTGLTAVAKEAVAVGGTEVTITVNGTPSTPLSAPLTIVIPAASLSASTENLPVTQNANAKFEITGPSATVADVTISGASGTALAAAFDVVITIDDDSIATAIALDDNLASWITNLPSGLTAKAKSAVAVADTVVTIKVEGTPTEKSSAALEITIPATYLDASTADLTVTTNANAKFAITGPSATVADVTISGTTGSGITATNVIIAIEHDSIGTAFNTSDDLSGWINLPAGLSAAPESAVASGATSLTIVVSGTPTATSSDALVITIPAAALASNAQLVVDTNADAKFDIQ
jgi:hypothetical protein